MAQSLQWRLSLLPGSHRAMSLDTTTLTTIVVTAVVTAIARRLVSAIESWLKTTATPVIVTAKVRPLLNRFTLDLFIDGAGIAFLSYLVAWKFSGEGPAMKEDLRDLFYMASAVAGFLCLLAYDYIMLHRSLSWDGVERRRGWSSGRPRKGP